MRFCTRAKLVLNGKISLRAVLPYSERRAVLSQYHDERTSAHLGFKKTLEKIKAKFYWPGLQKDVKLYVAGYEKCQRRKAPTTKRRRLCKSSLVGGNRTSRPADHSAQDHSDRVTGPLGLCDFTTWIILGLI